MRNEFKLAIIIAGMITAGISYIFTENKRSEVKKEAAIRETKRLELYKVEKEATLPPEYWSAKEAETKANVEIEKAKIKAAQDLEYDSRNRADREKSAIRQFEKEAPESYWEHKKIQEQEVTKREQLKLENERAKRLAETERDIAKRNAEAIERGAKTIERAVQNSRYNDWSNGPVMV